ncbi:AraC family transcriptional regulator [Phytoactinopolyspora halotolerans]|uniref:AraC family transcriptional regulator n=2 Tax=Phytoactinopolyspora halotolerans TaxID=1981512 RepID=A0A6L9SBQ7_9ACTN|nr:AraC family transcriptional regulator [Phytoactinopolyspora halotolerans]
MASGDSDLLSELLAPLRLHGVFHSRWSMRAPWGIAGEGEDCALIHYVHEGRCIVEMPGAAEPIELEPGDLAVFPHGTAHRLGDRPGRSTVPLVSLLPDRPPGDARSVQLDGPGPVTTMLCGGLHYDVAAVAPLYRALPTVFVLDADALKGQPLLGDTMARLADNWTDDEPGAQLVALRAFELAFVLALRTALSTLADDEPVWRALNHPAVSPALLAVQTRFNEPWTLEKLAAEAGLSRSSFAATFRRLVGQTPMEHLAARRLQEAARLLIETTQPHERIAERVGYRSGVGFHLAFRNRYGQTPGEYRRTRRPTSPS